MANPTQNGVLKRDDNDYPVMGGTSTVDNATIINSSYDPITRRLLTTGTGGGGGTPGGLNTQLQYNNNGVFGGITGAVTDGTAVSLTAAHLLNPTINGAGTGLATLVYPNTSSSATITFPTVTGTLATLAGSEALTNKSVNGVTLVNGGTSTLYLSQDGTYTTPGGTGSGTVTTVSVVSANGFAGTVATATTTPAITLSTSITGILQGNGTAISAATTTGSGSVVLGTAPSISGATITTSTVNGVTLTTGGGTTTFLNANGAYSTPAGAGTVTSVASADSSITVTNPTSTVDLAVVKAPIWTTARLLAGNSVNGSANVPFANKFIVQGTTDAGLSGAQFLGALTTGIVKNTTTTGILSIATSGTDYSAGTSGLTTGILKSTTTTGALTIAVAADFPTLNQNTSGSAATLTTARTIGIVTGDVTSAGSTFDGSANNTNALTLATVNGNVGSFTNANITVNGKGLITAASNGTAGLTTLTVGTTTITSGTSTRMLYDNGGVLGETTGITTNGTVATLTTPVLNGTPTGTGVATAATASTLALRDANGNLTAINHIDGYTTTATAAGTTVLTVGSTRQQFFTGSTTQTVTLPVVSTLVLGQEFEIVNLSSGLVTINSSGGNAVLVLPAVTSVVLTVILVTGTTAASWDSSRYLSIVAASGKKLSISNTLTLAGTDATTMTFPSTSATIARTDAAQTFTGVQTLSSSPVLSTNAITGSGANTVTLFTSSDTVVGRATTDTLSNKNIQRRLVTVNAPGATPTTTMSSTDIANFTGIAANITSMTTNLSTTGAVDGQLIEYRFLDNGTARTITWGASFSASTVALPTTTVLSTTLRVLFEWNTTTLVCIAVA